MQKSVYIHLITLFIFIAACTSCTKEEPTPPPCHQLQKVEGDNQTIAAGEQLPVPLKVKVVDDQGNPVVGRKVSWDFNGQVVESISSTDGIATLPVITAVDSPVNTATITAKVDNEDNTCTTANVATFSVNITAPTLTLTGIVHKTSNQTCTEGKPYVYNITYESNVNLSNYNVVVVDSAYCVDSPTLTAKITHEGSQIAVTPTEIGASHCIVTNCSSVVHKLRVELRSKTDQRVIHSNNSLNHTFENPDKPAVTVNITNASGTLRTLNNHNFNDGQINGSTFTIAVRYSSNVDLLNYYTELIRIHKFPVSGITSSGAFQVTAPYLRDSQTISFLDFIRFANEPHMEATYQIKIYEKTSDGGKGAFLKESNLFPIEIIKPTGANRVAIQEETVSVSLVPAPAID